MKTHALISIPVHLRSVSLEIPDNGAASLIEVLKSISFFEDKDYFGIESSLEDKKSLIKNF